MAVCAALRSFLGSRSNVIRIAYRYVNPQQLAPVLSVLPQNTFGNSPPARDYAVKTRSNKKVWKWFKFSGDLVGKEPIDNDALKNYFRDVPEIKNLSPEAQRIFSLGFADRMEKKEYEIYNMLEKIISSLGPDASLEKKIARATLRIRCMKIHVHRFWKDKRSKSDLNERIAKRRKWLKQLKKLDRERFIWICQQLKLYYRPVPRYEYFPLSRKGRRKKAARKKYFALKIEKIVALQEKLEKEKDEFYKYKEETLNEIQKDLKELNLTIDDVYDPSDVSKQVREKKQAKKFVGRVWY